jgi:hypothetical protein
MMGGACGTYEGHRKLTRTLIAVLENMNWINAGLEENTTG